MAQVIYIIEDDESIRELLKMALTAFSYEVYAFSNAEDALLACADKAPSLAIFDIMLPGMNGIEAVKKLREKKKTANIPIIMLTAKGTELDKVVGLDAGADDYIAKPFGIMELSARVRALLRRSDSERPHASNIISIDDIVLNIDKREVTKNSEIIELTFKEFELLAMLMHERGRAVPREEILNIIWGYDYVGETRTLDIHIRTLRQKLSDDAENPRYIKTVRGIGYRFADGGLG